MSDELITRFAPSPTGHFHIGHVLSMIYVFGIAKTENARVLLRIEDHDKERCREEYIESMLCDMEWLGFIPSNWEMVNSKGFEHTYRQSFRLERYQQEITKFKSTQLIYHCKCSRKEIQDRTIEKEELYYDGQCRHLQIDEGPIRLKVPDRMFEFKDGLQGYQSGNPSVQCGDFILIDKFNNPTYNFAVAVDDVYDGIDFIVRGEDLLAATTRQLYIRELLNATNPLQFYHHPLLYDESGKKLSKRFLSTGLNVFRDASTSPQKVIGEVLSLAGLNERALSVNADDVCDFIMAKLPLSVATPPHLKP